MKRLLVFSVLAVVMSLWAVSCSKEQDIIESNPEKEAVSEDSQAKEGTVLTFTVSTEYEETKTTWDGSDVIWTNEEVKIIFVNGDTKTENITVDGENVTLTVTVPQAHEGETFYVVSPSTATAALEGATLSVTIPEAQDGSFASANIMAAKVEAGSQTISFKALSHVMKFTLSAGNIYDRFKFTANKNSSVNLVGTVSTDFSKTGDNLNVTTEATGKYVDVSELATGSAQTYYFAVVPGQDLSKGIAFKAHKSGETAGTWQVGSYSTTNYGSANRLQVAYIYTLDTQWIRTKWFIKTDGGDTGGASWDKAGNVTRLVNLLAPASADVDPEPASWKLFGADIYVASGTYDLQTAKGGVLQPNWGDNNITTIHGGYDAATKISGTDVTGQNVDSYATNFVNKESVNNDRIFRFQDKVIYNLSFDGITFTTKGGINHNSRGQVMYVDGTSSGTINFNNCRFKDMVSSNIYGAPCFDFNTSGTLNVNYEGCTFSGNQCTDNTTYGGTVLLESGSDTKLTFTRCSFTNNSATGTKGGGALFLRAGTTILEDCTFTGNTAVDGATIYSLGASETSISKIMTFNSTFDDNDASNSTDGNGNGGSIYLGSFTRSLFANSTFTNTTALNDQGVFTLPTTTSGQHPYLYLVSCTISNNSYDITRNLYTVFLYNSILTSDTSAKSNHFKKYSIINKTVYADDAARGTDATLAAIPLNSFNNGVFPLNNTYESYYSAGMSVTDLQNLTFTTLPAGTGKNSGKGDTNAPEGAGAVTITLTDAQKDLLAYDQKGNPRNGTIMGAYVLTE